jgi:predicted PurR-regulated permease PerM
VIWVPAVIYLLVLGKFGLAIFLLIWSIVVVGMADNFLRPALMKGDTGMSSAILFFAILGGINLFGLIGVIYGPLIFGICWMLLQIYDISTRIGPTAAAVAATAAGPPAPPAPAEVDTEPAPETTDA